MIRSYYITVTLFFVVVLGALLWMAKLYEDSLDRLPEDIAQDFNPFLQRDTLSIPLSGLAQRAQLLLAQNGYIEELIIRKAEGDGRMVTLFPVWYDLDHPNAFPPENDNAFWYQPVVDIHGNYLGDIYLRLNTSRRYWYVGAVSLSILLIAVLSIYGIYMFQTQEQAVRHTTSLLEAKQRELIHLERLAMVGQITASLLHDLKKPILNIRSELEQLDPSQARLSIQDETDFFMRLIRDLQLEGFIRKDAPTAEFLDVSEVLERSLKMVRYARNGVQVEYDFPEYMPFIFGHRHQLIQVFSNLLINAFQAMEGQGRISIHAVTLEDEDNRWLEISFTDNGPGMAVEVVSRIFEPFFSSGSSSDSTGLGLCITQSIVESMGGTIEVHSIPKHGTTFTLRFPLSDQELE